MKQVIISHKLCCCSEDESLFFAGGGFPAHIGALCDVFDATVLLVPVKTEQDMSSRTRIQGNGLEVRPLTFLGAGRARKLRFLFWAMRNLPRIIQAVWSADVVHAIVPGDVGSFGIIIARLMRKKLYVRYCGRWDRWRTVAELMLQYYIKRFSSPRSIGLVTGVSVGRPASNPFVHWVFSTSLNDRRLADLGKALPSYQEGGAWRLITIGRQEIYKGTAELLHALPLVVEKYPLATLTIIGDGSEIPHLRETVLKLGMQDRVVFKGEVKNEEVVSHLQKSHLFCLPSYGEGFAKVFVEAAACGVPSVATPFGIAPEISDNCCILLDDRTPQTIAGGIMQSLASRENYESMAAAAPRAARAYSLESWGKLIDQHLSSLWGSLRNG